MLEHSLFGISFGRVNVWDIVGVGWGGSVGRGGGAGVPDANFVPQPPANQPGEQHRNNQMIRNNTANAFSTATSANESWPDDVDIVVVGFGCAGACAALEAADAGAHVLVLERFQCGGCSTARSGGVLVSVSVVIFTVLKWKLTRHFCTVLWWGY